MLAENYQEHSRSRYTVSPHRRQQPANNKNPQSGAYLRRQDSLVLRCVRSAVSSELVSRQRRQSRRFVYQDASLLVGRASRYGAATRRAQGRQRLVRRRYSSGDSLCPRTDQGCSADIALQPPSPRGAAVLQLREVVYSAVAAGRLRYFERTLRLEEDFIRNLLSGIDGRHERFSAFNAKMLSARAEFYRVYANQIAFLIEQFGSPKWKRGNSSRDLSIAGRYSASPTHWRLLPNACE